MKRPFTHGSLFSGIGGFDLAAHWMGWENKFHCEINDFGQRILTHYWPDAKSYHDIKTTDFTIWRGLIDVLSGGFPCQPYSTAGKRKGKDDERHLWPEMLRAIREIQPRWIVGENVRGLTNWNGGVVFDEVQADLEAEGYEVLPFLLPACAINAPHRRDRIWFIANAISNGHSNEFGKGRPAQEKEQGKEQREERNEIFGQWDGSNVERIIPPGTTTNASGTRGFQHRQTIFNTDRHDTNQKQGWQQQPNGIVRGIEVYKQTGTWQNFPTQSPLCGGDDGLPAELDGITISKHQQESIKGYGNAVVPQLVYQIFKTISQYEATIFRCV